MTKEKRGISRLGWLLASTAIGCLLTGTAHAQLAGDPTDPATWRTPEFMAQYGLDYTYADWAYARGLDGSGVKIGLVDTGIDMNHPEFAGQNIQGVNWADTDWSRDIAGHGTSVAAIIIGKRDGQGMHGLAPGAGLLLAPLGNKYGESDANLIPAGISWLADQGVPFILLEWGFVDLTAPEADPDYVDPVWLNAVRHAVGKGSILIVPTHNGSRPDANLDSGMPYLFPELEQGWIAVTGYGYPFANQCGVAKNWCLAAPADYIYTAQSGGGYWSPSGTSYAGPHVAGAAALVAQMFPYMTPEQVRQVLLGTAIDIGDPGVDDVYGYGFVCAGCAVYGPGKFDWGDFHAVIKEGESRWSNNITGDGGLIKSGNGVLVLNGDSTYLGDTRIDGGVLAIDGNIASDTFVEPEGMLSGIGTIFGNVDNSGTVYAGWGRYGGTLTVDGNYRQREDSRLLVELGAPDGTSLLDVTGTAIIEGGSVDVRLAPGGYRGDARHTILSAGDGVAGQFADVCNCYAFLDFNLTYDPTNVYLDATRNSVAFADVADTRNGAAVASGIESLGVNSLFYGIVTTLNEDEAAVAFNQLTGEIHASLAGTLITQSSFITDAASSRLRAAFADPDVPALPVMAYGPHGPELTPATTDRFAFWSQGLGARGKREGTENAVGMDHSIGGVLFGGDAALGDAWRLGVIGGYSHTTFESQQAFSSGSSRNIHLGLYAGTEWGPIALRTGAAYTWNDIETRRRVQFSSHFSNFDSAHSADYDAGTAQVFGELGYRMTAGNLRLEPFARLAHANVRADGFAEKGAEMSLISTPSTNDVTFTTIGLHATTDFSLENLVVVTRGMLGWRHAFGDTIPTSTLAFAGGTPFMIEGLPISRNALAIEAGLDFQVAQAATLGFFYAGQITSEMRDHSFKVDLAVKF